MTDGPHPVVRVRPPHSPFDKLRSRWLLVQFFALLGLAAWVYDRVVGPDLKGRAPGSSERLGLLLMYSVLGLLLLLRGRLARLDWRGLFGTRPTRADLPLLGVIVPVDVLTLGATIAVYIPLSYLAPRFVTRLLLTEPGLLDAHSVGEWLQVVFVACVAAPFIEELLFRGVLLHRWARRWGTFRAVIASSLLFAVLHGEWVGHFLFGVAMCALYLRTRKLWAPILAHASSNFALALFTLRDAMNPVSSPPETLASIRAEWPTGIVALVAGSVLLWWYLRTWWPDGQWRTVVRGPTPYDSLYAAAATSPVSISVS